MTAGASACACSVPAIGERVSLAAGDFVDLKVTSRHSEGRFTFFEMVQQPGHPGVPLHVHETHDELWYILQGTLRLRIGEETYRAETGSTYFVPRHIPHAFRTEGEPCRFLGLFTPGGFEGWFIERTELLRSGAATPQAMMRLPSTTT